MKSRNKGRIEVLINAYKSSATSDDKLSIISELIRDFSLKVLERGNSRDIIRRLLSIDPKYKKKLLGQVFTPSWIADYMAALAIKDGRGIGLEPCFGKGIFIKAMAKRLKQLNIPVHEIKNKIYGIELDPDLFIEGLYEYIRETGNSGSLNKLYIGSFFDYHEKIGKFDYAMMNPPYVRQEDLSSSYLPKNLRKGYLSKVICDYIRPEHFTKRYNLYAYFFIHLSRMLKKSGRAVIITYNSWLFSRFGRYLQRFLLDNFLIKYIIDFDQDAFGDALIGSCVILMEKRKGDKEKAARDSNEVQFIRLKAKGAVDELVEATESDNSLNRQLVRRFSIRQSELYHDNKWEKYFYIPPFHRIIIENDKLIQLSELSEIYRGAGTKANRFFLLDNKTIKKFGIDQSFVTPILKDPREIPTLRTSTSKNKSYLLCIRQREDELLRNNRSEGVLRYLRYIEDTILNSDRSIYPTLVRAIKDDREDWFKHKTKHPGDILFSYIIRSNKPFFFNDDKIPTTDNFYNLLPKVDSLCLFSILNSTLTRYMIEMCGRTQGSGLLKVQLYELKGMKVPDVRLIKGESKRKLRALARALIHSDSKDYIHNSEILSEIDRLIFEFIGLSDMREEVQTTEEEIRKKRLARKRRGYKI